MNRLRIISLLLFLSLLCYGQETGTTDRKTGWERYEFVYETNPWLQSYNAAGLHSLSISNLSEAAIYFDKKDGKLINYYQSNNSLAYGAEAKSLYRLNPKVVFAGTVRYSRFEGKNMGGSVFIRPYENPFNIVEYADSTRGKKELETYFLSGAFSADVYKGLMVGAKVDYEAANYAKHRDLRHKNTEMDLTVTAGLSYQLASFLEAGINYSYRRRSEDISFGMYGNTDQQFNSLIDFGAFYGHQERFSDDGKYTEANAKKPLFEEFHGGSLQLDFTLTPRIRFFSELTYKSREGYYGKRGTASIVYSEHDSKMLEYRGNLSVQNGADLHTVSVNISREALNNYENSYQKNTLPNGNTVIDYLGQTEMLDKTLWKTRAEYTAYLGVANEQAVWTLKAAAGYNEMKQTVSLYPNFRKQDIHQLEAGLSANRTITKELNQYDLLLGLAWLSGGGTEKEDGTYDPSSQGQSSQVSLDWYLYREFEYLTTERLGGTVRFRYSRLFPNRMRGYAQAGYTLTNAFSTEYIGKTFSELTITVGVSF